MALYEARAHMELEKSVQQARMAATDATTADLNAKWSSDMMHEKEKHEAALLRACNEVEARTIQAQEAARAKEKEAWIQSNANAVTLLQRQWHEESAKRRLEEQAQLRQEHEAACRAIEAAWMAKWQAETMRLQESAAQEMNLRVSECMDSTSKMHEAQMALVTEESEKLIGKVEEAMVELKKQKEVAEHELRRVQQALEEAEDAAFDIQEEFQLAKKHFVFSHLMLLRSGVQKLHQLEDELDSVRSRAWQRIFIGQKDVLDHACS